MADSDLGNIAPPRTYRRLRKRVDHVVEEVPVGSDLGLTLAAAADSIARQFCDELGICGGRIYRRQNDSFGLVGTFGDAKELPVGLEIPISYEPIQVVLNKGILLMRPGDPRLDIELEDELGAEEFAAIETANREYILAFDLLPGWDAADAMYSLGLVRNSLNRRFHLERAEEVLQEARRIQASILPRHTPDHPPYQIAARTEPLEIVGGDFFDFIRITDKILGVAIADVSGHGLPAALQVRDIHMGLKMGMSRDFKIVRTVERLNSIIHASTLTSRFVSTFYGELERNGNFIYVNAGFPPPLYLAADGRVRRLHEGGAVLGPLPDATYERGFVYLQPGDQLVLFTDGLIEAAPGTEGAEEFGTERLIETVRSVAGRPAEEVVEAIFAAVEKYSESAPPKDDRTAVVVTYPAGA